MFKKLPVLLALFTVFIGLSGFAQSSAPAKSGSGNSDAEEIHTYLQALGDAVGKLSDAELKSITRKQRPEAVYFIKHAEISLFDEANKPTGSTKDSNQHDIIVKTYPTDPGKHSSCAAVDRALLLVSEKFYSTYTASQKIYADQEIAMLLLSVIDDTSAGTFSLEENYEKGNKKYEVLAKLLPSSVKDCETTSSTGCR